MTDIKASGKHDFKNVLREVKYARDNKAYGPHKKIECSTLEGSPSHKLSKTVMIPFLEKNGGEQKDGVAPPGDLERKIQAALDTFVQKQS